MGNNKETTILVTDSGLGGLSVVADVFDKLKKKKQYKKVNLVFADALFDANSGYNKLSLHNEKVAIFSKALTGMEKHFAPSIILIACNTLSVLYNETNFANKTKTEVVGIVEFGVKIIQNELRKTNDSEVIIFATETTINSNNHKIKLVENGINADRIFTKACPQLQSYIERNPNGLETRNLISKYVTEVLEKIDNTENLSISLNCTHFGYSLNFWHEIFEENNVKLNKILDPNNQMSSVLFSESSASFVESEIQLKIVSKVKMPDENKKAMMLLFNDKTPELSKAIENYEYMTDLFL